MMKENQLDKNLRPDESADNLRAEYTALSSYSNTLVGFRLTLLGFYLATVALIVEGSWPVSVPVSLLVIVLTLSLYLFELRTRILLHHLAKRAIEIEQVNWNFKNQKGEQPFFSRQLPKYLKPYGVLVKDDYYSPQIKILGIIPVRWRLVSHSLALDVLYLGILIFFIVSAVVKIVASL